MLSTLHISNYALIKDIDIEFGSGLNIITGETGSGKSIVLGALGLLMGDRADSKTVRNGENKTVVEARFLINNYPPDLNAYLASNDIDTDDEICIMRREVTARGTSRAFINDTPVTLNVLKGASTYLLDIHTQHQNIMLTDPAFQLEVIDSLAGNTTLLEEYRKEFHSYKNALKRYTTTRDNLKRNKAEAEYNSYLLGQLDALDLKPGEQDQLEQERDIIANAAEIKLHLSSALDALSRADNDILSRLSTAETELVKLSSYVSESESLTDRLESVRIEIADIVDTLEEYDNTVSASGTDLDEIERRLGEIYSLQSRHNVSTDTELIAVRERLRQAVAAVENGDTLLADIEEEAKAAKRRAVLVARRLNKARTEAAASLAQQLKERALPMGMANLRCEIRLTSDKLGETGMDSVDFLFAFNKNQSLMPVGKTASGGEISRVFLALKSILVEKMNLPTVIFDEVDTGVSGDVANRMAELMLEIGKRTQVITITHIATVAAHGARHFKVYKADTDEKTNTYIRLLDNTERQHELAAMISGDADDAVALQTARALLAKRG